MACESITAGYNGYCKGGISGIKAFGIAEFNPTITTTSTGSVGGTASNAAITASTIYHYNMGVNDTATYSETEESSEETGTTIVNGTLAFDIPVLSKIVRDQMVLMSNGRPQIYVEFYNGDIILAGVNFGCFKNKLEILSGMKRNDMAGFKLSFTTRENTLFPYLEASAITAYKSAISDEYMDL
ncbi:MAG: hypothetical protein V4572_12090 [Bacteroidota bacterium]